MADTYTWSINNLDRELSNGAVYTVHWSLTASRPESETSEEVYTVGSYGSQGFTADPLSDSFVPFEDLTEATCIEWITDSIGTETVDQMKSALSSQLDELETPTQATGVPW